MTPRTPRRLGAALLAATLLTAAACGDDDDSGPTEPTEEASEPVLAEQDARAAATGYADVVFASYGDVVAKATALQEAVHAFVDAPSEEGLAATKQAWLDGRVAYGPTEAFRFYDGPIDDPEDGPEGQINAWPLDEAYIDYVEGDGDAGLVNDVGGVPELTTDVLVAANEEGGETNISTGWHAIEFLLWGQDLSPDGPGARPLTDYTTGPNAERRGTYLALLADLLVADLTGVRDEWDPASGAYREEFLADPQQAVGKVLLGMATLSGHELAGERISVAYENQDQEDEHSCFSDNTTVDIVGNATGIRLAYSAIADVVSAAEPELDGALRAQLDESVAQATALPAPFDQLILSEDTAPGRVQLLELITLLEAQGNAITELADTLGLS